MTPSGPVAPVAILLSTFEGAAFLPAQLESYAAQTGIDWHLYWRDDGSTDASVAAVEAFAAAQGNRCTRVGEPAHIGVTASYMALLRAAVANGAVVVAFSDQDDVWLPHKLARGFAQLGPDPAPALYCSRQILVDAGLHRMAESSAIRVTPGLGPALTQNIATGCTVMMNAAAARLVSDSSPPCQLPAGASSPTRKQRCCIANTPAMRWAPRLRPGAGPSAH